MRISDWSSDVCSSDLQPTAIAELVAQAREGERNQVLLGVTGSGKTFTMAKVVEALQRPALVLAPNKILAAQLYGEFKSFFPENSVEYFVSYRSEEHTSELQSLMRISYAVSCLKKKNSS